MFERPKITLHCFCLPGKLVLGFENFVDNIDRKLRDAEPLGPLEQRQVNDIPVGLMLLMGLADTFPCEAK